MPTKRFDKKHWKMVVVLLQSVALCCCYVGLQ